MANKKYIDLYKCREDFYNDILSILSDDITNDRANEIIDVFDSLPTADVQEKKDCEKCIYFGRHATEYPCSHCRNCYTDKFQPMPNCGARMDGDV